MIKRTEMAYPPNTVPFVSLFPAPFSAILLFIIEQNLQGLGKGFISGACKSNVPLRQGGPPTKRSKETIRLFWSVPIIYPSRRAQGRLCSSFTSNFHFVCTIVEQQKAQYNYCITSLFIFLSQPNLDASVVILGLGKSSRRALATYYEKKTKPTFLSTTCITEHYSLCNGSKSHRQTGVFCVKKKLPLFFDRDW